MSRVASNSQKDLRGPALASPARRLRVRQASGLRRDRKRGGAAFIFGSHVEECLHPPGMLSGSSLCSAAQAGDCKRAPAP